MADAEPIDIQEIVNTAELPPDEPSPQQIIDDDFAQLAASHAVSRPDLVRRNPVTGDIEETCSVIVNGMRYEDWKTVWIQWNWSDQFSRFRLTCAEREPYPLPGEVLQLAPQDEVAIFLGGILVITGFIVTRQVIYDGVNHAVQLEGVSASWMAQRSSIEHKTNDFDNKSFLQIATEILAPTGVGYKTVGNIDNKPFKSGATPPTGATIGQFLESLARDRKIIVSNTPDGDYLFIGEHSYPALGDLIEGENIKRMQCIITSEQMRSLFNTIGQKKGDDTSNMKEAAEQEARKVGALQRYSIKTTAMEHPVASLAEIARRNDTEKMWDEDLTKIEANVTVYGWFRQRATITPSIAIGAPSADLIQQQLKDSSNSNYGHILWQAGDEVVINSPMAMLKNQQLKIRTVTWMQDDNGGTSTTLQCVLPNGLNGANAKLFLGPSSLANPAATQTPPAYDAAGGGRIDSPA